MDVVETRCEMGQIIITQSDKIYNPMVNEEN